MARALSNEEFGRRIGVSASVASRIRAGKHQPSLPAIYAISDVFRIPITDLVLACLDRDTETGESKAQAEILALAIPRLNEKASA